MSTEGPARRRPRVVGMIALAASALVLVAAIASLSLDRPEDAPVRISGAGDVQRLFGGIEQEGARLGSADAPVTIDLFNDMACKGCAEFQLSVVPGLVEDLVRPGEALLVYRHFPMGERRSSVSDLGALAAAEQGRQWQWVELFFINQAEAVDAGVTQKFLDGIAAAVLGLDTGQWRSDFDAQADDPALADDAELAIELRLPAQPAVVVTGPGGSKELDESPSLSEIKAAVNDVS